MQDAFANMFKAIGKAFLDLVAQMLAQQAILMVLRALTGAAATPGAQPSPFNATDLFQQAPVPFTLPGRADGGSVERLNPYVVGENGAELFVPNASGTIIPNDAFVDAAGAMRSSDGVEQSDEITESINEAAVAMQQSIMNQQNSNVPNLSLIHISEPTRPY